MKKSLENLLCKTLLSHLYSESTRKRDVKDKNTTIEKRVAEEHHTEIHSTNGIRQRLIKSKMVSTVAQRKKTLRSL